MTDLVPARPATPDELTKHPAATFGKRAQLAGWRVEYRAARGPLTVRRRPAEPDERGKYALISVVETVDTLGVRAAHPDGRRIAAWWVGRAFGEGWAASPRRNATPLGIRALTNYLTEIEEDEMDEPEEHMYEQERWGGEVETEAWKAIGSNTDDPIEHGFVRGYIAGHAAATEKAGDAYGEGYASGLAALTNHAQVWVKTQRRLDALRPGDVILGKGDRWWIVTGSDPGSRTEWYVTAMSGAERVEVKGDAKRKVDVVEPIAIADALAALRELGAEPIREEGAA